MKKQKDLFPPGPLFCMTISATVQLHSLHYFLCFLCRGFFSCIRMLFSSQWKVRNPFYNRGRYTYMHVSMKIRLKNQQTVDPWTTQNQTAWVHLCAFFKVIQYSTVNVFYFLIVFLMTFSFLLLYYKNSIYNTYNIRNMC